MVDVPPDFAPAPDPASAPDSAPDKAPPAKFSWTAHPARERRSAAWGGVLGIAAIAAGAAVAGGHLAWSLLAVLVLLLALNRFFFPSRFVIDENGITARYPLGKRRLEWRQLRRFVRDGHGGYLSTRARRSWTDAYRGMHILFGPERRAVETHITAAIMPTGAAS